MTWEERNPLLHMKFVDYVLENSGVVLNVVGVACVPPYTLVL